MDTYVEVIQIQLKHDAPRESSPSRQALREIMDMLAQKFDGDCMSYTVPWWWLTDALAIQQTLASSVAKMPPGPLCPGEITVNMLQTLAEYIAKWYAAYALNCAAILYERILAEIDGGASSSSPDPSRAYVVRELAKAYVEVLGSKEYDGSIPAISSAKHSVIQGGLREIEKCGVFERLEFYQNLGALYVRYAAIDSRYSSREGERVLRNVYETQKQLFGLANYRCVRTVDILSRHYVKQGFRDVEAAQLIQDALQAVGFLPSRLGYKRGKDQAHQGNEGDEDDEEDAEDVKKREAVEKWEVSVALEDTRATSDDIDFPLILSSGSLQARLMSLLAPSGWAWQDSRFYLCDMIGIRFRRVTITDVLENYPVRLTRLRNGLVDVQVPITKHLFSASDTMMSTGVSEVMRSVRESHFYQQLLRVGAAADQLPAQPEITLGSFEDDGDVDSLESEASDSSCETSSSRSNVDETSCQGLDLTAMNTDYVLWVFPRDLGPPASGRKGRLSYQLQKLPGRPDESMVLVTESTPQKSDIYSRRSRPPATYLHHVRHSSWKWLSSDTGWACSVSENNGNGDGSGISAVCPYVAYDELRKMKGFG